MPWIWIRIQYFGPIGIHGHVFNFKKTLEDKISLKKYFFKQQEIIAPEEICSPMGLWMVIVLLQPYNFCLLFILFLSVWNVDPQLAYTQAQCVVQKIYLNTHESNLEKSYIIV